MLRDKSLYVDLLMAIAFAVAGGVFAALAVRSWQAGNHILFAAEVLAATLDLAAAWLNAKPVIAGMKEGRGG